MTLRELDAATRELYEQILAQPDNGALRRALELPRAKTTTPQASDAHIDAQIVLVPGIFYADYPHTGADGAVLRQAAAALGLPFAMIPIDGTEGLDAAAATINAWLRAAQDPRPIVLFSLSKGSAEVRHALTKPEADKAFERVTAWISVSGLPFGTPAFERFLRNPLRHALVRAWFWLKRWRLDRVRDLLRHRSGAAFALPSHLQLIQVAAFPAHEHLRDRRSRWLQAALAPLGPNDGFALLDELAALPGRIYPIWGADHYLRNVDDLPSRIERLVEHVIEPRR